MNMNTPGAARRSTIALLTLPVCALAGGLTVLAAALQAQQAPVFRAAVDLIAQGVFGKMVRLRNECVDAVDIAEAIGKMKSVDPQGELVRTARAIGISFGD